MKNSLPDIKYLFQSDSKSSAATCAIHSRWHLIMVCHLTTSHTLYTEHTAQTLKFDILTYVIRFMLLISTAEVQYVHFSTEFVPLIALSKPLHSRHQGNHLDREMLTS